MRFLKIVDPAGAAAVVPARILETNRADRILIVTEAEYDSIALSGVIGDELEEQTVQLGASTGRADVTGIYECANVAVAVPSITDPDIAKVDVDVAAAFTVSVAVGSAVIAIPQEALPTNCRYQSAIVTATDTIQVTFGSEGGNVTGANKNFTFLVFTLGTPAAD